MESVGEANGKHSRGASGQRGSSAGGSSAAQNHMNEVDFHDNIDAMIDQMDKEIR